MQLHLTRTTDNSHDEWDIEWVNRSIRTQHKHEGITEPEQLVRYQTKGAAFQAYRQFVLERLKEGYNNAQESLTPEALNDVVFHDYLSEEQYDLAEAWLKQHQAVEDERYENALVQNYIDRKAYADAEKYILRQLQGEDDLNRVMRQIRYLSLVNPLLSRFMIGNLLQQPLNAQTDAMTYYRDLAKAQAIIGMFEHLNPTLEQIGDGHIQLEYLTQLLSQYHEGSTQQVSALQKAQELLKKVALETTEQQHYYQRLIEAAEHVQQTSIAKQLREQRPEDV